MSFLQDRINEAQAAGDRGDARRCRRILEHAVAEDPTALERIKAAVDRLPQRPTN